MALWHILTEPPEYGIKVSLWHILTEPPEYGTEGQSTCSVSS